MTLEQRVQELENVIGTLLTNLLEPALVGPGLDFGGGKMRLDNTGIKMTGSFTSDGWLTFLETLHDGRWFEIAKPGGILAANVSDSSQTADVYLRAAGNLDTEANYAQVRLTGSDVGAASATIRLDAVSLNSAPNDNAALEIFSQDDSDKYVKVLNAPFGLPTAAGGFASGFFDSDGMVDYDTTADKMRLRQNGSTVNIATEPYADAAVTAHTGDTSDAHDASSISILDAAGDFTATDVEGALAELQSDAEGHAAAADPHTGYLLANGTRALSADWDAGSVEIRAQTFESDVTTGTAPLVIASTTKVTNLNADLLDDQSGAYYLDSANFTGTNWTDLTDGGATTLHTHASSGGVSIEDREVTQIDVVSSVAETDIFSYSVPGGTLGSNKMLRLTLFGDYLNNSGAGAKFTIRVKFGAVTWYQDLSISHTSSASRRPVTMEVWLGAQNASNSQMMGGLITVGTAGGAASGVGNFATDETQATTPFFVDGSAGGLSRDSTSAQTFAVSVQHTINSSNISFRRQFAILELL